MTVIVVDTNVGAHTVGNKLRLNVVFDQPDVLLERQLAGQRYDDLSCKPAYLRFLRFLYGVPQYRAVLPCGRRRRREKDALVFQTAFSAVIMRQPVVVVMDKRTADIRCRRDGGTSFSSCDRLCF